MRQLALVLMALALVGCALDSPFEMDLQGLSGAADGDDGQDEDQDEDAPGGEDGGEDGDEADASNDAESSNGEEGSDPDGGADPEQTGDEALPDDVAAALEVLRALEQSDADHDELLTSRARAQLADDGRLAALSEASHLDVQAGTWERHNHLARVTVDLVADDGSVQATYFAWLLHRPIDDDWRLSGFDPVSEG